MKAIKVIICGAAGRDFHNFNVLYRTNGNVKVVAFTATQIPNIDGRKYPPELAGPQYPDGIPIYAESELASLIREHHLDEVLFFYSDVTYNYVMQLAAVAMTAGAKFSFASPTKTKIESTKPVVLVCAVRTGCGKSQTARIVSDILTGMGKRVVAIRHPMPYGNLVEQKVQRFACVEDLHYHKCTIEEMEEYEPYIGRGRVIYAGVDYEAIVREAEKEADKRVLVVEDGPTLTHGEMKFGAGIVAAQKFKAREIIDPRPYTVGSITETFIKYPNIGILLPAMGYGVQQVNDLEETINRTNCDAVIIATPTDLTRIIKINKPTVRVKYELEQISGPDLKVLLSEKFR